MLSLFSNPALLITRILTLVIAFTVHEFSHAFSADRMGDDTPRMNGRLTLNPAAHLDLIGSLLLLIAGFGWAKPVPINPYQLLRRSRAGVMLVSLAGPASNLVMAALAAIPLRLGWVPLDFAPSGMLPSPGYFLLEFMFINIILFLFNLIPLAPLDGDKIIGYFLPPPVLRAFEAIRPYGPIILLVLVFALPLVGLDVISWIMTPVYTAILRFLLGVSL
jgi:Zn-dependent protease